MIDATNLIGRHKYNALKKYDFEKMTTMEMVEFRETFGISVSKAEKLIQDYENAKKISRPSTEEAIKKRKSYNRRIIEISGNKVPKEAPKLEKEDFKKELYNRFLKEYYSQNNTKYIVQNEYLENLKPIMFYFLGDLDNFLKCENLYQNEKCKPSLSKGLLIIGDFGNGKTSTLKAFSEVTKGTKKHFRVIGTKEAVTKYSFLKNDDYQQEQFYNDLINRNYLFDDLLKENDASSYGKINLIEQVLEEKYRKNKLAHGTLNYKEVGEKVIRDIETAVLQIGEKYGNYMYDRVFSMFNIIEFKGKSLRGKKQMHHSKIIKKLEQKDKQSGGHCGLYIIDFEGDFKELKKKINDLYVQNKITIHDGIHGKLIKIKS